MPETSKLKGGLRARVARAVGGGAVLLSAMAPSLAWAAKSYHYTGKVTAIQRDAIAVSQGVETLEFKRESLRLGTIKVGDEITIRYSLDAESVEPVSSTRQQPGRAAPATAPSVPPIEKKQIIIDDRAFYDARGPVPAVSALQKSV